MANTREILTFQFGTYANYVGAHFWNQQEANFVYAAQTESQSSDVSEEQLPHNDILYREGLNDQNQTTYTPRLLAVDLAGTLGHLPVGGELYGNYLSERDALLKLKETAETNLLSTGAELDLLEQPPAPICEYQKDLQQGALNTRDKDYQLAQTSQSWADFLYARYHPRTLNVLQQLTHEPDTQTLATHAAGVEIWQAAQFNDDFCDRIRLYAEECDALQGFQLLFDIDDGFSGLATKCLEHLNDEYSRASFVLPLHYPRSTAYPQADARTSHGIRVVNAVLSYQQLIEQASLFTPLSTLDTVWRNSTLQSRRLPGLSYLPDNLYQTSAVLASYLDTISLGYRLRQSSDTLLRFCDRVCMNNRKLTAAALALPLGMRRQQDLIDYLDAGEAPLLTQLTPGSEPGTAHVLQSLVARGVPASRLKRPREQAGLQQRMAAYGCDSVSQMLQLYYQCTYHNSVSHALSTPLPLRTQLPFPYEIFAENVAADGFVMPGEGAQREAGLRVDSAPALAALQSSSRLGEHLDALHAQTHRVQLAKLQRYSQAAIERDEYEAALDRLLEFRDNYSDEQYL